MNWQPIETAPKDDTVVDIWLADYGRCTDMVRVDHDGDGTNIYYSATKSGYTCVRNATHWMKVEAPLHGRTRTVREDVVGTNQEVTSDNG